MLALIFLNSLIFSFETKEHDNLSLERPNNERLIIDYVNTAFTFLYIFEFAMKAIYKGLWKHKRSHARSGWTLIDIAVIISG